MMCCEKNKSRLMMLGCLLPIILLIALPFFGVKSQYLRWLGFLACPLAMVVMMRTSGDDKKCH